MVTLQVFNPQTQKLEPPCTAQERVPEESTAQQLSFEWSHFRTSYTDSKVRTTLYNIINSTTGKYCSVAFNLKFGSHGTVRFGFFFSSVRGSTQVVA